MADKITGESEWAAALDRRELNHAHIPMLMIALAATVVVPMHDPYMMIATPMEYWSGMLFHFMMVTLGAIGGYAFWVAFAPHAWLAVFPGFKQGTDSAKAVKQMRDDKAEKAKTAARRREEEEEGDEDGDATAAG
jgi:hypothetical protein